MSPQGNCVPSLNTHARTKVEGTPAFPRWGSLRKRLLLLQDFPTPAQAPPSPERGSSPSPKRPPERRLGVGPARRHWLCGWGRKEDFGCARRPSKPHIPADGFAGADRRDPDASEEVGAARSHPERGSRRGRSARPYWQVSEGLPTPPVSSLRGVGAGDAPEGGSPSATGAQSPPLGRPRVAEAPLPPEPPRKLSPALNGLAPFSGHPRICPLRAGYILTAG